MKVHLTEDGLEHILDRLKVVYGVPKAWKEDPSAYAREWMNVLKYYRVEELNTAVDRWIASGEQYRPKPGDLKSLLYLARPKERVWTPSEEDESVCPCGCRWDFFVITRADGTTTPRWIQGCRAKREGLSLA